MTATKKRVVKIRGSHVEICLVTATTYYRNSRVTYAYNMRTIYTVFALHLIVGMFSPWETLTSADDVT